MYLRRWFVCFLLFQFVLSATAQEGKNPFDLSQRIDSTEQTKTNTQQQNPFDLIHRGPERAANYNPFDVQKNSDRNASRLEKVAPLRQKRPEKNLKKGNFDFILYTGILILFTLLFTFYRPLLLQIYRAFVNDNILKLLHRDQLGIVKAPYIIWYCFFFLSLSAFLIQAIQWYQPLALGNLWLNFGVVLLAISGLFLAKHLILILIGAIFPLNKELGIYSFTIILFSITLGLMLIPINLLAAFGPVSWQGVVISLGLGLIFLVYGYRTLRAIVLTSSKWGQYFFHFFIYLCTVEIAPIIVLFKLVISSQ